MRWGVQGWCTGMTLRDGMGREVGGGLRMGCYPRGSPSAWLGPVLCCPRSRDRDPLPSRALRTRHILPHPPSPPLPLLLAPCQPAPNTVPPAGCSPTRDKPARSPLLSYLPTEGPPCRCPAHLSAPRSPRTTVPSGCVNTLRPPLHGIWVPPVPRVWPARAVPRHLSLPSRDPGVQGEKDAGWPGTPGPSGFNSGHPDVPLPPN